jgi:hypothetical protein
MSTNTVFLKKSATGCLYFADFEPSTGILNVDNVWSLIYQSNNDKNLPDQLCSQPLVVAFDMVDLAMHSLAQWQTHSVDIEDAFVVVLFS